MKHLMTSLSNKDLSPYLEEELDLSDEMSVKIERLMKFFDQYGIDYGKFNRDEIPSIDFGKKEAYPNNEQYMHIPGQHNTQKWIQAIGDLYRYEQNGENRVKAIRKVTNGWNIMETFDFLNWIKYYESGDHMKYKFANLWYENDNLGPGYFLQIKQDPPAAATPIQDVSSVRDSVENDQQKRQMIERQRNKIIGRLDSAEKLLRSPEGHIFSGKEFESLLEAIYQLKKQIQMINKVSTSTRLYDDLIVRQANVLVKNGFTKAANVLASFAQTPAASAVPAEGDPDGKEALEPASPGDPSGAGNPGAPGGLPSMGPGMPQGAPSSAAPKSLENQSPAIQEFLAGLNKGQYSPRNSDNLKSDDLLEVSDSDELLITEAQLARPELAVDEPITTNPAPAPLNPATTKVKAPEDKEEEIVTESPIEISEDDIVVETDPEALSNFDNKVEQVFSGITIADVVAKLEDLAKIFKTREVPRQLGIVDMMLDSLGLASFFPSLSEATNKALESNNYISTRVEEILSKLHGAMSTRKIDLKGNDFENPQTAGIRNELQKEKNKEIARKQMRRNKEDADLQKKETPEIEVEEDLSAVPEAVPAPATPIPPAPPAKPTA